jgi:hypothetical protein
MKRATALSALLPCLAAASFSHAAMVEFPGHNRRAPSPDGRSAIINTDHDEEPNHVLSIRDKGRSSSRTFFSYPRYADVSWAPDSKLFFVNDYDASDDSRCVVWDRASLTEHDTRALWKMKSRPSSPNFPLLPGG